MALQGPEELGEQVEEPEDLDDQDASSISPAEEITLPPGPGGDDETEEALLLPWDRFSAWLHCICVVGFDLELGQAVEVRQKDPPETAGSCQTPLKMPKLAVMEGPDYFLDLSTQTSLRSCVFGSLFSYSLAYSTEMFTHTWH